MKEKKLLRLIGIRNVNTEEVKQRELTEVCDMRWYGINSTTKGHVVW